MRGWFRKSRSNGGHMAVSLQSGEVCAAVVERRNGKPVVTQAALYAARDAATGLAELGRHFPVSDCSLTLLLNSGEYQLLSLEAPSVPPEEMKAAVRWRLKELLDFPVEEAAFDVLEVPGDKDANGRSRMLFAAVARNTLIRQQQALFEDSRLPLRAIDIPEMAQRNLSILLQEPDRGLALLSFDDKGGLLTITCNGELVASRRFDVSLSQLARSEGRAESQDRVTIELQRSFDHFERQHRYIAVSRLLLAPMGESSTSLQQYLKDHLYLPVEALDLASLIDFSEVPALQQPDMLQRHLPVLGAALREMEVQP